MLHHPRLHVFAQLLCALPRRLIGAGDGESELLHVPIGSNEVTIVRHYDDGCAQLAVHPHIGRSRIPLIQQLRRGSTEHFQQRFLAPCVHNHFGRLDVLILLIFLLLLLLLVRLRRR